MDVNDFPQKQPAKKNLPKAVYFNSWHEEFDDEDEALNCSAFGLSSECRLKEFNRNGEPYK